MYGAALANAVGNFFQQNPHNVAGEGPRAQFAPDPPAYQEGLYPDEDFYDTPAYDNPQGFPRHAVGRPADYVAPFYRPDANPPAWAQAQLYPWLDYLGQVPRSVMDAARIPRAIQPYVQAYILGKAADYALPAAYAVGSAASSAFNSTVNALRDRHAALEAQYVRPSKRNALPAGNASCQVY
jgi:hypothetical protein